MYIAASFTTAAALLALWPLPGAEGPVRLAQAQPAEAARQANCRKAQDEAVMQLRRTPATEGRDKARKDELEARIVALIAENRRKGVDECVTWSQVMGIAFSQ